MDPPLASRLGLLDSNPDAPHQTLRPHRPRSVENARAGTKFAANDALTRRASSPRDASNFQANNPLFKERAPELHVAFRPSRLSPDGRRVSRFMTLHSLRITLVRAGRRRLTPTPRANRLSSDAPFSDRLLPDRMNGAGIGRPGAPSTAESTLFGRTSFLARTRRLVSPKPRPGRKRADQAPLIDFCNRREGRAHPRAARYPARPASFTTGGWPAKATGGRHRLPGWESSSRAAGHLDPTKRRPKGERPARSESGHPCRAADRKSILERGATDPRPEARLRPAARTVRPSNEPGYLHLARNRDTRRGPSQAPPEPNEGVHFSRTRRQDPRRSPPQRSRQRTRLGGSAVRPKRVACGV